MRQSPLTTAALPLMLALVALLSGCIDGKTVHVEYTVEQTGLVPAPRGPHGAGPIVEPGQVSLEGTYIGNTVFTDERARYEGERGNVMINHAGALRFAVGLGNGEIGFDGEMMSTKWGVSVPDDTDASAVDADVMFRLGLNARGYLIGDNHRGFGLIGAVSLASLPYHRDVYQRRWLTEWTYNGDPEWWKFPEAKHTYLGERTVIQDDVAWYAFFQAGVFGSIGFTDELFLQLGLLAQNQPSFFGTRIISETCAQTVAQRSYCVGENPSDLPPTETEFLGTVFASLSYQLGMVVFVGQLFGHPIASEYDLVANTPFGGDLTVRVVF